MACGEYDLYVIFAKRLGWTPETVNDLDPHFVDELMQFWQAESDKADKDRKDSEAKTKRGKR